MRSNLRKLAVLVILVIFSLLATRLLLAGRGFLVLDKEGAKSRLETSGYAEIVEIASSRSRRREDAAPAYAPGAYMADRGAANLTSCSWHYGLPRSLAYPTGKVDGTSPGADDEHAPYRVLPDVVRGRSRDLRDFQLPSLTLCTHASADQLYHVVELARRWEGALSLAVFAPGLDAGLAIALLERACRCEPVSA